MIDANQQKFWMLSEQSHFALEDQEGFIEWNQCLSVLRFLSARNINNLPVDRQKAKELADQAPTTFDAYDTWATVDETGNKIIAGGVFSDPIEIFSLPNGEKITDMAMNNDGILYAIGINEQNISTIYLINRLGSREEGKKAYTGYNESDYDAEIIKTLQPEKGGRPDRIVALSQGGALVLDRENRRFWQVIGKPLRDQPQAVYSHTTHRPCFDGPEPQLLIERPDLELPHDYEVIAMASNPLGETALLLFPQEAEKAAGVVLIKNDKCSAFLPLSQSMAPFSIGWVKDNKWAVLSEYKEDSARDDPKYLGEAIVYPIPFSKQTPELPISPLGQYYPIRGDDKYKNKIFCNALSQPVRYQSSDENGLLQLKPLYHLSYLTYPANACVYSKNNIDSGQRGTVWHRIYVEANLPKGTGFYVFLAAADDEVELENNPEWIEHYFGDVEYKPDVPRGVWLRDASEVPYHQGLLYCPRQRDESGLFMALIQRSGHSVRTVQGRYLRVKIELTGNGNASPELAALRIYAPRFSYLDHYLPELYRETEFRQETEDEPPVSATGADFMQRFLCLFESILTPLEDKAAAVYMLTNPESAPPDALEWLGKWVNMDLQEGLPESRKRLFIKKATELYRNRGTVKGLMLALDIATDNMVKRGDIILLEDFRLRRTFATILGADLSQENDPLLMGKIPNANSYVGDTLLLGEEERKEFLALYARDLPMRADEQEVIDSFYARLANKLTVLVHQHTNEQALGMIRGIVSMEIPAHIEFRVVLASKPLLIGLYSLVGVDTYLQKEPERRFARVGQSFLGRYDFIKKLPVLDERLEP